MRTINEKPQPTKGLGLIRAATRTNQKAIRATIHTHKPTDNLPLVRLPGTGKPVGKLRYEAGCLVWERTVGKAHVLRMVDGWTINRGILRQLSKARVDLVRYVAPEGVYEITLSVFMEACRLWEGLANGEDVYSLPRSSHHWHFQPNTKLLGLFDMVDSE